MTDCIWWADLSEEIDDDIEVLHHISRSSRRRTDTSDTNWTVVQNTVVFQKSEGGTKHEPEDEQYSELAELSTDQCCSADAVTPKGSVKNELWNSGQVGSFSEANSITLAQHELKHFNSSYKTSFSHSKETEGNNTDFTSISCEVLNMPSKKNTICSIPERENYLTRSIDVKSESREVSEKVPSGSFDLFSIPLPDIEGLQNVSNSSTCETFNLADDVKIKIDTSEDKDFRLRLTLEDEEASEALRLAETPLLPCEPESLGENSSNIEDIFTASTQVLRSASSLITEQFVPGAQTDVFPSDCKHIDSRMGERFPDSPENPFTTVLSQKSKPQKELSSAALSQAWRSVNDRIRRNDTDDIFSDACTVLDRTYTNLQALTRMLDKREEDQAFAAGLQADRQVKTEVLPKETVFKTKRRTARVKFTPHRGKK